MASRGSAIQRFLRYVREAEIDEVRVAFTLAKEIVERRLAATQQDKPEKPKQTRTRKAKQKELAEATQAHKEIREVAALVKGETLADA